MHAAKLFHRGVGAETCTSAVLLKVRMYWQQEKAKRAKEAAQREQTWFEMKVNTSVYVTGLPSDATDAELAQVCRLVSTNPAGSRCGDSTWCSCQF